MSHQPPVPEANQPPYPRAIPSNDDAAAASPPDAPAARRDGEAMVAVREAKAAKARREGLSRASLAAGAAIGIGSAALVAALLYARSGRKSG